MPVADSGKRTGAQSLSYWARETPQAIAIVQADRAYPYAATAALVAGMARHLSATGLPPGSIVGIECIDRFVHLIMILACECLGLATTSLVEGDLAGENQLLSHCAAIYAEHPCARPQTVLLDRDLILSVTRTPVAAEDYKLLDYQLSTDSSGRIVKTSGTTGMLKYMLNNSIGIARAVEMTQHILDRIDVSQNFVCLYPFSFRPSYTDSILALQGGRTIIFAGKNDLFSVLAGIKDCHTVMLAADAVALADSFTGPRDPAIRCGIQLNGSSLSLPLRRRLLATFASVVFNVYSMNETNYVTVVDEHGVGTLLPDVEIRIADDDGRDVAPGETGLILIRSARMVAGYLWDEERTAQRFVDGWHVSGDLGFQPASDKLVVIGRADDMLNIGGIKVPPQPIEAQIKVIEGVRDAVLLAIDDEQGVAEMHLVIERSDPALDAEVERKARSLIHAYGRGFVAHYLEDLPRTETGKIRRAALRTLIKPHTD